MGEFKGLLFIPGLAPFDYSRDVRSSTKNIRLYVKRVFISDSFQEELVPTWLSFVKGVIDSKDLPLNVSREILQESRIVRTIRNQIISRSLTLIKSILNDTAKLKTFWESFGKNIKMGIVEDTTNREELARICRFKTSRAPIGTSSDANSVEAMTTLDEYVSRMKEGQTGIYYFATATQKTAKEAPFIEKLIKEGYEVLFMTETLDEYVAMNLAKFKGRDSDNEFELIDVTRENVEVGNEKEETTKTLQKEFEELCKFMKDVLKDKIEKVIVSTRLDSSPCMLVTSKYGWSANMERIMKAQAGSDARAYEYMRSRRCLEINPNNKIIRTILEQVLEKEVNDEARNAVELIYQTALLTSGFDIDDPQAFSRQVYDLMEQKIVVHDQTTTSEKSSRTD